MTKAILILSLYCVLATLAMIGFTMNIVAIIHTSSDVLNGLFIARVIGVFVPPIGSVLGWF